MCVCVTCGKKKLTENTQIKESLKPEYLTKIPETLKTFSDFLGDKDWLMGSQVMNRIASRLSYELLKVEFVIMKREKGKDIFFSN